MILGHYYLGVKALGWYIDPNESHTKALSSNHTLLVPKNVKALLYKWYPKKVIPITHYWSHHCCDINTDLRPPEKLQISKVFLPMIKYIFVTWASAPDDTRTFRVLEKAKPVILLWCPFNFVLTCTELEEPIFKI